MYRSCCQLDLLAVNIVAWLLMSSLRWFKEYKWWVISRRTVDHRLGNRGDSGPLMEIFRIAISQVLMTHWWVFLGTRGLCQREMELNDNGSILCCSGISSCREVFRVGRMRLVKWCISMLLLSYCFRNFSNFSCSLLFSCDGSWCHLKWLCSKYEGLLGVSKLNYIIVLSFAYLNIRIRGSDIFTVPFYSWRNRNAFNLEIEKGQWCNNS